MFGGVDVCALAGHEVEETVELDVPATEKEKRGKIKIVKMFTEIALVNS